MKISLLLPTRKRYNRLLNIINQLSQISEIVEVIVGIDVDDDSYDINYLSTFKFVTIVRTPKTKYLSNIYNILFEYSKNEIIGYISDDIKFTNLSKFYEITTQFENDKNFLYYFSPCDDPFPKCVPDHAFVTRNSIILLGFLFPNGLEHGYCDHFIGRLYKEIGLTILDKTNFIIHERDSNDETTYIKSFEKDENGLTCDDRDLVTFNKFCENFLEIQKKLILESNQLK